MRILLIIPPHRYTNAYPAFLSVTDFPTGLAYLAASLRNAGNEVFGLNLNNILGYRSAYEMIAAQIRNKLNAVKPELICLGGICIDFKFLKDAISIIRTINPDIPIVCGGGIITHDAEFVFKTLHPDFCISGEGEETIVQLVEMLKSGDRDYDKIANLGYWKDATAILTRQDFNYGDLNLREFPDYEPFNIDEMLDVYSMAARYLYRYPRPEPRPMPIVTARACPFNCSFCVHKRGPRYRARTLENIMQEIETMYERYHFNILIVLDELFAVNKQKMEGFCATLLEARIKKKWDFDWLFQTHASASLDRAILALAKEAGCYFFSYGLESASPRVLASMNKKTVVPKISEAISIANEVGIGFGGNFIFGDVAETEETICETMDFFKSYCRDIHVYLGPIQPYPGSQLFEQCLQRKIITNKDEFYETVDERPWNMTSLPNAVWFPWIYLLSFLGASLPWLKATEILRYEEESQTAKHPMVVHSNKIVCKIWAKCPYCGNINYYREMLKDLGGKQKESAPHNPKKSILSKIKSLFPKKRIKSILQFCLWGPLWCFYHLHYRRMFKALKDIMKNEDGKPFFVTGCPHCNKMIKIYTPSNVKPAGAGLMAKKILIKVI